jgi:hypothetical protein
MPKETAGIAARLTAHHRRRGQTVPMRPDDPHRDPLARSTALQRRSADLRYAAALLRRESESLRRRLKALRELPSRFNDSSE